jgi:hypothetical protein
MSLLGEYIASLETIYRVYSISRCAAKEKCMDTMEMDYSMAAGMVT